MHIDLWNRQQQMESNSQPVKYEFTIFFLSSSAKIYCFAWNFEALYSFFFVKIFYLCNIRFFRFLVTKC